MASSTLRLPTISKEGVKHILLAWLAVRVLSSGFFGRAVTAAAAGALAFGARQMPGLVPGAWRGGGGGGVARHAGGGAGAPGFRPHAGPRRLGMGVSWSCQPLWRVKDASDRPAPRKRGANALTGTADPTPPLPAPPSPHPLLPE